MRRDGAAKQSNLPSVGYDAAEMRRVRRITKNERAGTFVADSVV